MDVSLKKEKVTKCKKKMVNSFVINLCLIYFLKGKYLKFIIKKN